MCSMTKIYQRNYKFHQKSQPIPSQASYLVGFSKKPRMDDEAYNFFDTSKVFESPYLVSYTYTRNTVNEPQLSRDESLPEGSLNGHNTNNNDDLNKSRKPLMSRNNLQNKNVNNDVDQARERLAYKLSYVSDTSGVYDRYEFGWRSNQILPIHDHKEKIISGIRNNPVIILVGDTGCGKTMQVPQYILDEAYYRREYCKIVCTQPRRIAAISIAKRVCEERKWPEGSLVAHQIGLNTNISKDTRLVYCTTAVLLQELIREKSLLKYTHILLDEVHERDQEMDFLLFVIRRLLTTNSKQVKIVLMSATINASEFSNYFNILDTPAPILKVNHRRMFEVKEFYLCDLEKINPKNFRPNYDDCNINEEMYTIAFKLIVVIDNLEKRLAASNSNSSSSNNVAILIFLPGIHEILHMSKKIEKLKEIIFKFNGIKLHTIPLHSSMSPNEQLKVFNTSPEGYRKVILSTNIAESSVTVPNVKYVIDFCLTKLLTTNSESNFTSLQLHWASQANCRQRAGRTGRLMNGRVYRLVERSFYEKMDEFGIPEMLRCPLENVILKAKVLNMGSPWDVLSLTMTPPNLNNISNSILILKELGALHKTVNGSYSIQDGDMTYHGRIMADCPLNVHLTRLIILGYIFGVLNDAIIMAAGLSVRSVFMLQITSQKNNIDAYIQKLAWADGSGSDLFAILKAYKTWTFLLENNKIKDGISENDWAKRFFINLPSIKEMHLLIKKIYERLKPYNIKEQTSSEHHMHWMEYEKTIVLKVIIAGAFYPNYFIRPNLNDATTRDRNTYHTLCGNDPCSTVYFTNFNNRYIGQLYTRSFKELFKVAYIDSKHIEVRFQSGSERAFITFTKDSSNDNENRIENLLLPGRVKPEVYKAIRMRMSHMTFNINVMNEDEAIEYASERALLYGKYYRAKVLGRIYNEINKTTGYEVLFIDIGCTANMNFNSVRKIPQEYELIPPRVFECRLAMVQPSTVKSLTYKWSKEAKQLMEDYANINKLLNIEVYSVVHGIANVFIKLQNITLNELLIEKQFASKTEENYLSKIDHDLRLRNQMPIGNNNNNNKNKRESEPYIPCLQTSAEVDVDPPPPERCNNIIKLNGPYSPLETKIYSIIKAGVLKSVKIERNSVNSVLINTDPQDIHERLFVAADVTESSSGYTIIARGTTLMPNIRGFAALVTMIFCPTMQIKCDETRTKYTTILAGLGYNSHTLESLHREHDLSLDLDVEFEMEDIQLVNCIRYNMDAMLYTEPGDELPNITPSRRLNHNEVLETADVFGDLSIFPMHSVLPLNSQSPDIIQRLLLHCKELHNLRQFGPARNITCRLCNQPLDSVPALRLHLLSQLHRDREEQIHF
uniref:Probable ATP-dependent RNA helicase spindle-E n=1 Tax=Glossina brevipalpis TaxID=37001 RepID=A0A1A9X2C1_9MUSC